MATVELTEPSPPVADQPAVGAVTVIMGTVVGLTFLFGFGGTTWCCCCGLRWATVHLLAVADATGLTAACTDALVDDVSYDRG